MANGRPAVPKRTDPAKLRREQQAIAEDFVNRELTKMQGDRVSTPPKPVSPPALPTPSKRRTRTNPTSRQGVVTGFRKGSNTI